MRNSIVLKFIALLLCAVSLLGVVGSAGGILVLTETGMYDKTAEDLYEENLKMFGEMLANSVAKDYAETELGGCSPAMTAQDGGIHDYAFENGRYGYSLMDADGKELKHHTLNYDGDVTTYTFSVTGQYMHLVELSSAAQKQVEEAQITAAKAGSGPVAVDIVPAEGSSIAQMEIVTADGNGHFHTEELGTAFHNQDGLLVFRCAPWVVDQISTLGTSITYISLWDDAGYLVYLAEAPQGIGTLVPAANGETLIFTSWYTLEPEVAETVSAETAAETVPETTAETEPETTEETQSEEEDKKDSEEKKDSEAEDKKDSEKEVKEASDKEDEKTSEKEEKKDSGGEEKEKTSEKEDKKDSDKEEKEKASEKEDKKDSDKEEEKTSEKEEKKESAEAEAVAETAAAEETLPLETTPSETVPAETIPAPVLIQGKSLREYQINSMTYWDHQRQEEVTAKYVYVPMPQMTVEFFAAPEALKDSYTYTVLGLVRALRGYLLPALGICLLTLAISVVYLCCSAGRKPRCEEVRAGGLNRLPVDLYAGIAACGVTLCAMAGMEGGVYFLRRNILMGCVFGTGMAFLACLLVTGFGFAFVAQIKTPGGFWWRNSLVGWSLKLIKYLWRQFVRLALWLEEKMTRSGVPMLIGMARWVWNLVSRIWKWFWNLVKKFFITLTEAINRFCDLLPLTWQWMLAGFVMVMLLFVTVASRFDLGMVLSILFAFALVLYGAHCFGILLETTKKMNKGDLDNKVDDKLMVGAFKTFAQDLNDLADVAVIAAKKQLKSERMKTELITNVSHDIKTPLTSIINYVDLLQKPHTEEEQQQYLEVLDRQSQRLKKLIDDLMDMSKASTGNMAVDVTLVDAVESVNQALGEFADKLDRAQLIPVFRHTEPSVTMMADGKLVWRVLSNLLGNAVKYAMPGTRLYIDLMQLENKVVISLKNISREELNVDAEELMERFVRGDDSRNTEGSGLGLNIAKSLMELQKGQLQLLVDGDLFKVTLIFPGA